MSKPNSLVIPDAVADAFTRSCQVWYRITRSQKNGHGRVVAYQAMVREMGEGWMAEHMAQARGDLDWIESRFRE